MWLTKEEPEKSVARKFQIGEKISSGLRSMFAWVRKIKMEKTLYSFKKFVERNFLIPRLDFSVTVTG